MSSVPSGEMELSHADTTAHSAGGSESKLVVIAFYDILVSKCDVLQHKVWAILQCHETLHLLVNNCPSLNRFMEFPVLNSFFLLV